MRQFIQCLLLLPLWAALSSSATGQAPAAAKTSADGALRSAYIALIDAELAADACRWSNAAAGYSDALALFEKLAGRYPGWQFNLIDTRIAGCRNSLEEMRRRQASGVESAPSGGDNAARDEARRRQLRDELRNARAWLAVPSGRDDSVARWKHIMALERSCVDLSGSLNRLTEERERLVKKLQRIENNYPFLAGNGTATNANAYPHTAEIICDQARRYLKVNEHGLAVSLLKEAHELMPGDLSLIVLLGTAMCMGGDYQGALALLTRGVPPEQVTPEIRVLRGSVQMALGNLGAARVEMEKVLKNDPNSAAAHYNMAQLLVALDPPEGEEAREHYALSLSNGGEPDKNLEQAIREARLLDQIKKTKSSTSRQPTAKPPSMPLRKEIK